MKEWLGMTVREYAKRQCDKCDAYLKCDALQSWLTFWREHFIRTDDYVTDGCDIAKICWKFNKEVK